MLFNKEMSEIFSPTFHTINAQMNLTSNYWFLCAQNGTIGNPTNGVYMIQWLPFTRRNRMLWRKTPPLTLSVRPHDGS